MPSTLTTTPRRRGRRRKITPPQTGTPIYIIEANAVGVQISIVFDQPVILNGLPGFTVGSSHVTGANQTGPTEIELTFNGSTTGGAPMTLPFQDPAIRNASGGYVTGNQVVLG